MLETYFDEYYNLWNAKLSKIDLKYAPANLIIDAYGNSEWHEEESDDEEELDNLQLLEVDCKGRSMAKK